MTQPPGWYPDASLPGQERWWDGNAWSPVTRPIPYGDGGSVFGTAPAQPDPASAEQPDASAPRDPYASPSSDVWAPPAGASQPGSSPWQQPGSGSAQEPGSQQPQPGYPQPGYEQPGHQQPGYQQPADPYAGSSGQGAPNPPHPSSPASGYPSSHPSNYPSSYPSTGASPYDTTGSMTGPGSPASRGLRLVARIIDGILLGIVTLIVGFPFLRQILTAFQDFADSLPTDGSQADPTALISDPAFTSALLRFTLLGLLINGVYHVVMIALRGATLGKSIVGVKVQRIADQARPTWTDSLLRWATTDLPAAIPNIGSLYSLLDSLWCLWDGRRQCLHDKLPKTQVVRSR